MLDTPHVLSLLLQALALDKDDALSHRLLKLALDDALAFGGAAAVRVLMPLAPAGQLDDLGDLEPMATGAATVPRAASALGAAVAGLGFSAGAHAIDGPLATGKAMHQAAATSAASNTTFNNDGSSLCSVEMGTSR